MKKIDKIPKLKTIRIISRSTSVPEPRLTHEPIALYGMLAKEIYADFLAYRKAHGDSDISILANCSVIDHVQPMGNLIRFIVPDLHVKTLLFMHVYEMRNYFRKRIGLYVDIEVVVNYNHRLKTCGLPNPYAQPNGSR